MDQTPAEKADLKIELVDKIISLSSAGFGLVAALAWNDAIQGLFTSLFGAQSGLIAKFAYAVIVTVFVVIVTYRLGRWSNRLKNKNA